MNRRPQIYPSVLGPRGPYSVDARDTISSRALAVAML